MDERSAPERWLVDTTNDGANVNDPGCEQFDLHITSILLTEYDIAHPCYLVEC
jgi:hypothetical protein